MKRLLLALGLAATLLGTAAVPTFAFSSNGGVCQALDAGGNGAGGNGNFNGNGYYRGTSSSYFC